MTLAYVNGQPGLGRIWIPEANVSYPKGGKVQPRFANVVVATQGRRPAQWKGWFKDLPDIEQPEGDIAERQLDYLRNDINPRDLEHEMIWASVSHNERTNMGAAIQMHRCFGTTGTTYTAAAVFDWVAVGKTVTGTPTYDMLSIGSTTINDQTNEWTTIGLSRTNTSVTKAGYTSPGITPNATASSTVGRNTTPFSVTGTGTATCTALFDSTVGASTNMYVSAPFAEGNASVVNTDTLSVTWTITM